MDTTTATADAIASSESSNGNCDLENENITEVDEIEICIMKSKNKKLIVTEDEDSEVKVEVKVESDVHHTMNSDDEVVIMPHMSNGDIKIEDEHCGHDDNVMVLITNGPTTTMVITEEVDDGEDSSSDSSMISVICCDDSVNSHDATSDDSEDGSESDLLGLGIEEDGDSTPRVSVVEDPLMLLNLKTTSNSKLTSSSDDVSDVVSDVVEMFVPEHSNHKLVTNRSGRTKMVTFSTVASSSPTSPTKSPETMTNNLSKTHTTSSIVTCFANGSNNNNNKDNIKEINNNSNKQICRSTSSSELGPVPLSSIGNISNLEPEPEVKENGTTSVTSASSSGSTTFTVTNAVIDSSGPYSESANISDSQTTTTSSDGSSLPPTPSSGANESNFVSTSSFTELTTSSSTTTSSSSMSHSESQLPSPSQIMMSLSSSNTGTLVPSKNSSKLCPTIALASPSPTTSSSKGSYHNHVHNSHKHHSGGDNGGIVAATTSTSHYSDIMSGGSTPTPSSHPHLTLEVPYAILTNKDNSCPFFERRIALLTPAKVGRAIARVRPSPDNAIFDCKVLSRNHALLMYQDGKFFLKDTHSSNGTFVNDYRLSSANEMSQPHELFSGDCVKFGVEVIEKKQVYSCIIATIQLFLPDGSEAKPLGPHSHHHHHHLMSSDYRLDEYHHQKSGMNGGAGPGGVGQSGTYLNANVSITPSQLVELSFFIKDAIHKQCLLESQFDSMKEVMKDSMESAKHSWESLVEEDQLLNRIETLQAKLETLLLSTNKDGTEDAKLDVLQQEMLHLIEDKEKMEQSSKFAVQKAIESKTVTSSKLQASELELRAKELECQNLNTIIADNLKEMNNLVSNCDSARKEIEELVAKLRASKEEQLKLCLLFDRERAELQEKIVILEHHEIEMRFKEQQRQSLANPPDSNIYSLALCEASCQTELDGVKEEEDNKLSIQRQQISSHKDQEEFSLLKEKYQKQSAQLEFYQTQSVGLNLLMENVQSQLQQLKHSTVSKAILVHTLLNEKETTLRTVIEKFKLLTEMQHTKLRTKEEKLNELCERVVPELEEDNRKLQEKFCGFGETIDKLNQEIDRLRTELDKGRSEDSKTSLNHTESDGIIDFRLPATTNCLTEVLDSADVDITIGCHRRESKQTQTTVVDSAVRSEHINNNVQTNNMLRIILDKIDPHSLANCDVVGGGQSDGDLREELRLVSVNDTTVHKTTDNAQSSQIQKQLIDKIDQVCVKNREIRQQNEQLAEEIHTLRENYDSLHFRNELYSSMAIIPLLVIFVSIIAALNPILSRLTGTNEK